MKPVVLIVENIARDCQLMKQWIESDVRDVQVWRDHDLREAELRVSKHQMDISCIVLDMFFPSFAGGSEEAQGQRILDRFPDIPTVLISQRCESRALPGRKKYVPLLQLDKPADLFPVRAPGLEEEVNNFRRDLIEAVHCCMLVYYLRVQNAMLSRKLPWSRVVEMRSWTAFCVFLIFVGGYAASHVFFNEFVQHVLLALCAVTLVHLLDRVVLFKDFRDGLDAVHKRLDELSVEREQIVEGGRVREEA